MVFTMGNFEESVDQLENPGQADPAFVRMRRNHVALLNRMAKQRRN